MSAVDMVPAGTGTSGMLTITYRTHNESALHRVEYIFENMLEYDWTFTKGSFQTWPSRHWNKNVILTKTALLAAPEIVILTNSSATFYGIVVKIKPFGAELTMDNEYERLTDASSANGVLYKQCSGNRSTFHIVELRNE